jgi:hypothetical protein
MRAYSPRQAGTGLPLAAALAGSRAVTGGSATSARVPLVARERVRPRRGTIVHHRARRREAASPRAPALDRRRRQPPGDPWPPAREGPPAPGVWGQRPHEEAVPGSPAGSGGSLAATPHQPLH